MPPSSKARVRPARPAGWRRRRQCEAHHRRAGVRRREQAVDLVVFPELALCGYPPEDLLFHAGLRRQVETALDQVRQATAGIAAVVGYPEYTDGRDLQRRCPAGRRRPAGQLPQELPAQLQRLRRTALFHGRRGTRGRRCARRAGRTRHLRGRLGARPVPGRGSRRRSGHRGAERLALRARQAAAPGVRPREPRPGNRRADRLRQLRRRPGRTRLRRRLLRRGRRAASWRCVPRRSARACSSASSPSTGGAVGPMHGDASRASERSRRASTRRSSAACATTCARTVSAAPCSACPEEWTRR